MRQHHSVVRNIVILATILLLGAMVTASLMREPFSGTAGLSSQGVDATCDALLSRVGAMPDQCRLGVVRVNGVNTLLDDTNLDGNVNVQKRLYFADKTMNRNPSEANSTDPYYLEKVVDGNNRSHLRLTLNDDPDESLQVWGDSCRAGDCAGPGRQRHRFNAGGQAWHADSVCVDNTCLNGADMAKVKAGLTAPPPALGANGKDCVELGRGVAGKEVNAGKLCYTRFSDGLDIVGAGPPGVARKVRVWDDLQVHLLNVPGALRNGNGSAPVKLTGAGAVMHPAGGSDVGRTNTLRILSSGDRDGSPNGLSIGVRGSGSFGGNHAVIETVKGGVAGACDLRLRTNNADALIVDGNTQTVRVSKDATIGGRLCLGSTCVTESQLQAMIAATRR